MPGQPVLAIPTNAENADQLFDVFATLDGLDTEGMLAQPQTGATQNVLIWDAGQRRLH